MTPFVDSRDILDDGPALAARMRREGYLFVSGLLDPGAVAELGERMRAVAREAGWVADDGATARPEAACVDPDDAYVATLRRQYRLPALHGLPHDPAILRLIGRLVGGPVLAHPMVIPRNIFPQRPEFTTPAHQDFPHIQGTPETYAVWIPLSDCPVEMGGLQIAAGSHRQGVRPFRVSSGAGAMEVSDPLEGRWVGGDFALGDAVVFHSMTVHKGLPNRSRRLRQSIDARYQNAGAPVVARSLEPYAGMGAWEDIYAGWPEDGPAWSWRDRQLTFAAFDRDYYDRRDRMAFAMAEEGDPTARASLQRIVQRDPDPAKREKAERLVARLDSPAAPEAAIAVH